MRKQTFYVALNGSDLNSGGEISPFRTIQKAADLMHPGDTCIIRGGVYREWVQPSRGGISETEPITYKAACGEEVIVKGSEPITEWTHLEGSVWRVELADSFFGDFNPFKTNVSGGWLLFGHQHHLGEVYLNGESYCEKFSMPELFEEPQTWYTESTTASTIIYANFDESNPNLELTEINVRECIFFPREKGLRYITIDGLSFVHAAANWVNFTDFQHAAVGTYYGRNWIIENCHISDAKCAGLVCGNPPSHYNEGFDLEETGHHIVRNNWIRRCGEAGIHGYKGWVASLIEGNLIEDINVRKQFGGYESGGMKLHHAVDVVVRNNIVRRVHAGMGGQYVGIWIDWGAQGARVTGNIVYDIGDYTGWAFFIQNSHNAPALIDNNIFVGQVLNTASNSVFVHNLFVDSRWSFSVENMDPIYYKPHSAEVVEILLMTHLENDIYYNNIFIKKGTDQLPNAKGYKVDRNVYYEGARKGYFGEENSIVEENFNPSFEIKTLPDGVDIQIQLTEALTHVKCPLITHDFVGVYPLTGQGLEDHLGNPIQVDTDMFGNKRDETNPVAGPFENVKRGRNTFTLRVSSI